MNENFVQSKFIEDPQYIESKVSKLMDVSRINLENDRDTQLFEAVKLGIVAVILTIFLSSELVGHVKDPDRFEELEAVWFNLLAVARLSPSVMAAFLVYVTGRLSAKSYLKYIELDQELQKFSTTQQPPSDQV
jgi:hypothetical protein